jgi:methionyl-tRNA formyltransferase
VEETPIGEDEDFGSLSERLARIGGELLVRALDLRAEGRLQFSEQEDEQATYAEKIEPGERRLEPLRPAVELARTVRALTPHVGAYVETPDGERLGVRAASAVEGHLDPGRLEAREGSLLLGCAEGALRLDVVQPPSGRPMAVDAYLRGHRVPDRVIVQNE